MFTTPKPVEVETGGKLFALYQNRVRYIPQLRKIASAVAGPLNSLFASISEASVHERTTLRDGGTQETITVEELSQSAAEFLIAQRSKAVDGALDALMDERNLIVLGSLLMDSLRDEFPFAKNRKAEEIEAFLYGSESCAPMDIGVLKDLVVGWIRANAAIFGSKGEAVVGALNKGVARKLHLVADAPTDGKPSPTESSSSSDGDSESSG